MKKWITRVMSVMFAIIIVFTLYFTCKGFIMYYNVLNKISLPDKVSEIMSDDSYTTLEELPDIYLRAVISVEDHRFRKHKGIDIISIGRALWTDIKQCPLLKAAVPLHSNWRRICISHRTKRLREKSRRSLWQSI